MTTLTILILVLLIGLLLGLPIFMALGISTCVALLVTDVPLSMIPQTLFRGVDQFPLLAIPCFILAGSIMEYSGVTRQIIEVVRKPAGIMHGGLGVATILACMFFSAISGSGPGTVAAVGSLMIPSMIRGVIASVSITGMFLAGMVPGLMIGLAHCFVAWLVAKRLKFVEKPEKFNFMDFLKACWQGKWALASPVVILGGIYAGIFTPVEASIVAVFWALFVGGLINRQLTFGKLYQALQDGVMISGTVLVIVGTSTLFGQLLTFEQAPTRMANMILAISADWFIVMLMMIAVFYVLGMFMETLSTIIILTPVLLPVVTKLGIDPIHFGIIFVVTNEVAFLTPPLGVNLFVASKMAGHPCAAAHRGDHRLHPDSGLFPDFQHLAAAPAGIREILANRQSGFQARSGDGFDRKYGGSGCLMVRSSRGSSCFGRSQRWG